MAAVQPLAERRRARHHAHAEGHEQVDVHRGGVEQRAVLVTHGGTQAVVDRRTARAIEQAMPGVAQRQPPDQQWHHAETENALARQRCTHAVDVLPEEHRPEGRRGNDARPGHAGPEHLAVGTEKAHLQCCGPHPPEARQVQQDEAVASGKVALTRDPVRQHHDPEAHQQGQQHRRRQAPAGSHARLNHLSLLACGGQANGSNTAAPTQNERAMTRIEIRKGLPDLKCWIGARQLRYCKSPAAAALCSPSAACQALGWPRNRLAAIAASNPTPSSSTAQSPQRCQSDRDSTWPVAAASSGSASSARPRWLRRSAW